MSLGKSSGNGRGNGGKLFFSIFLPRRELVLAAARELELEEFPHHKSRDQDPWTFLIECLEATVLWDNDFEAENRLDASPEQSHPLKSLLGIPDNYYVAVPWEPSDEEADKLLEELHDLTRECRSV